MPECTLNTLLNIYNQIWDGGDFPTEWREATICKTFERMVNSRLVWYLEKYSIITAYQSGFRKNRSTIDENGFIFSQTKTVSMHICNLRKLHHEPTLTVNGLAIPVVQEHTYTEQNYKRNTEHFQRYFSVTVQVIYQIIQNTIMDQFATEF